MELTPLETLPAAVERAVGPKAPAPMKMMAARGMAPLPPGDMATALYQLSFSDDEAVKSAAFKSAAELPERILGAALEQPLDGRVLDFYGRRVFQKAPLLEKLLLNKATADETFRHLATLVDESGLEMIAKNEERLLRHPPIIAALYLNPKTRMSTAQRALELAVRNHVRVDGIPAFEEAARAIQQSGAPDPAAAAKDDEAFARATEVAVDQSAALQLVAVDENEAAALAEAEAQAAEQAVEAPGIVEEEKKQKISDLSPAGKIRLATLGNAFARAVLIRDKNRLVSMAAIRSPAVTDMEVMRYASNRGLDDEIVRYIASQRQWVRLNAIKLALCNNPKCPLPVAMRFLPHLNVRDLKALARSKGIPSALCTAAKQMLQQRNA
ncbi:MAG TPA: hypothetical protein VHB97_17675 [Polyangia bacterium]|jgi:hypothetical protein|nr:hypothetical protein [Polyangia bacterium]